MFFNYNTYKLNQIEVHTVGCELNMNDALKFALSLDNTKPSIVFNTCSLLKERAIESQTLVNLISKAYPEKDLYVLGCDITNNPELYKEYKNVYPSEKLIEYLSNNKLNEYSDEKIETIKSLLHSGKIYNNENYFNFKVQNGCHMNCAFCLINRTRRPVYSLPYKDIKEQLSILLDNKDNVILELCGTELSEYLDRETGYRFPDILTHLLDDFPQISKLHIGSLDPASKDVEKVIDIMSSSDRFVNLLNISAQSGSDTILKLMRRRHNVKRLKDIHRYADERGIKLGWDIIVGFPNETDELFEETVELVKELKPLCENIWKYSPREKTDAAIMENQIPENVKNDRIMYLKSVIRDYIKDYQTDDYNEYFRIFEKNNKEITYLDLIKNNENIFLNVFNEKDMINFIKNYTNEIVHIKFIDEKSFYMFLYINFIKTYLNVKYIIIHFENDCEKVVNELKEKYCNVFYKDKNILLIY